MASVAMDVDGIDVCLRANGEYAGEPDDDDVYAEPREPVVDL